MNTVYADSADISLFYDAHEQLDLIISHLLSTTRENQEHGEIEQYISKQGNELLRRLLQGTCDLRADNEVQHQAVSSINGDLLNHVKQNAGRTMTSIFGDVIVTRKNYNQRRKASRCPLDAELNLAEDLYSDGARHQTALEALWGSFDDAVEMVKRTTGGYVPNIIGLNRNRGESELEIHYQYPLADYSHSV